MNKTMLATTLCSMVLLVGTASVIAAPEDFRPGPGMGHMGPRKGFEMKSRPQAQAEHQARVAEFEKRLNLTAEQKAKIEKNREKSHKRLETIRKQQEKLAGEERQVLEQNRKDFEAVLTLEQKQELEKMKAEKRAEFEKKKEDFEKKKEEYGTKVKPKQEKTGKGCSLGK